MACGSLCAPARVSDTQWPTQRASPNLPKRLVRRRLPHPHNHPVPRIDIDDSPGEFNNLLLIGLTV